LRRHAENKRGEQRKIINFNHPLANCLIFHIARMMTRALLKLRADGVQIDPDAGAADSTYIRPHITRLRRYMLDLSRTPPPVDYDLPILSPMDSGVHHRRRCGQLTRPPPRHKWPQNVGIVAGPQHGNGRLGQHGHQSISGNQWRRASRTQDPIAVQPSA
jgi:hypothetical protein